MYRPAMTFINLKGVTVMGAKSLDSHETVERERTHCRIFAGGVLPVGHSCGQSRDSRQRSETSAGEEIKEKELNVAHTGYALSVYEVNC